MSIWPTQAPRQWSMMRISSRGNKCISRVRALITARSLRASSIVLVAFAVTSSAASAVAARGQSIQLAPIRAVVLIDESGSETPTSIASERDAAALLALSELSNDSSFLVAGFGSSNHRGQTAVISYCQFVPLSTPNARERAAACARQAHARTAAQGNDTDQQAALRFAVDALTSTPAGTTPVIFLMTDGVLDVSHSPRYGRTQESRNREALRLVETDVLPAAQRAGVQIWPIGFGPQANKADLNRFAAGGAGANAECSGLEARPHAIMAGAASKLLVDLLTALGRARCAHVESPASGRVEAGKTLTLRVTIPAIATDGAITVTKLDPSFKVSYFDPKGQQAPARGELNGQIFSLSGQDDRVEALRIENPQPGTWKIEITDPARHPGQTVSALAVWEGALSAAIVLDPPNPLPGQKASVQVILQTRYGVVRDSSALRGLSAVAVASGSFGTLSIPLNDSGRGQDAHAHDGIFSGLFTFPKGTSGCVNIAGKIRGQGIAADQRAYDFCPPPPGLSATFDVEWPARLHAGNAVTGSVLVTNQTGNQKGSLSLSELSNNALVTVAPARVKLANGTSRVSFRVTFSNRSPKGEVTGRLQLRTRDGHPISASYFSTRIVTPPGLFARFWWLLALAVLLGGTGVAIVTARRRKARKLTLVDGLLARLQRDGKELSTLDAPHGEYVFRLQYIDDGDTEPRLRLAMRDGEATLFVTRSGMGYAVEGPTRARATADFGAEVPIHDDVALVVDDASVRKADVVATDEPPKQSFGLYIADEPSEPPDILI